MNNKFDSRRRATIIISACFLILFLVIRSMPVEPCEVLHYGDYMNEEGAVEYCGEEETSFFDMTLMRYPVEVQIKPQGEVRAGDQVTFDLYLFDHQGRAIAYDDIVVSHTERIHLMVVDASLSDYQHIHPVPTDVPGNYQFTVTPEFGGTYNVFLDFISLASQRRVLAKSNFVVAGEPKRLAMDTNDEYPLGDYTFRLSAPDGKRFPVGEESQLELVVEPNQGKPAPEFGLVMGAYAHLVVFDENGRGFAHLHPQNPFIDQQDPKSPDLRFSFYPGGAGRYRLWAQLKVDGEERFVPFDLEVVNSRS